MDNAKIKEPVRLRERKLANGNTSLYLDIYSNGERQYEFLKLYLIPEQTKIDKETNKETLALANAIKAQRIVDIQNGAHGFERSATKMSFYSFFEKCANKRGFSRPTRNLWIRTLGMVRKYDSRQNVSFDKVTRKWICGFVDYMNDAGLKKNTVQVYYSKLKSCLHEAIKEGLISSDPAVGVSVKGESTKRMYLTVDELRTLIATPVPQKYEATRQAFLFSCLTGLRSSDIEKLTWGEVYEQGGLTRIIFNQKKTGGLEYLDINRQAAELMGPKEGHRQSDRVFPQYELNNNRGFIQRWCDAAGIKKHITFHCARHTFATMMLSLGTDIYTVSKLLGHSDVATTQIYAKVIDDKKREAISNIPELLQ